MEELTVLVKRAISGMVACYLADKLAVRIAQYLYDNGVRVPKEEEIPTEVVV